MNQALYLCLKEQSACVTYRLLSYHTIDGTAILVVVCQLSVVIDEPSDPTSPFNTGIFYIVGDGHCTYRNVLHDCIELLALPHQKRVSFNLMIA